MICVVDVSNIVNISYCSMITLRQKEMGSEYIVQEEDLGMFMHLFLKKIMPFITSYKDIYFCGEGEHSTSWRKSVFPPYKENRKTRGENPNFNYMIKAYEMSEEFLRLLRGKVLRVPYTEGDDSIYAVCKYYCEQGEAVKIVSGDRDLTQCITYWPELCSQYNPNTWNSKGDTNLLPKENMLLEKAICGDPADNIKVFKGIGPKTFEKMLNDKVLWNKKMPPENLELLETVMKIIDLRKYPQEYQDAIKVEIEKEWNEFKPIDIEKFMLDNGLKSCYQSWTRDWLPAIQELNFEIESDAIDDIMDLLNE